MFFNKISMKNISELSKSVICIRPIISRSSGTAGRFETIDVEYKTYGNCHKTMKPPLILFHGLVGTKNNWDGIGEEVHLRTGRQVISIDSRNHGDSKHSPEHTYFHILEDTRELLRKLNIPKVSVLGHSMGSGNAMVMALMNPQLVSSLAIEDTSPLKLPRRTFGMKHLIDCMAATTFDPDITISEARLLAHERMKTVTSDVHMRNYLIESLKKTDKGQFSWRANLPVLRKFLLSEDVFLPSIFQGHQYTGPTLFIGGSRSDFIRQCEFPEIKKLFPNADLTYVAGAGHFVHRQTPREFLDIICKFLIEK